MEADSYSQFEEKFSWPTMAYSALYTGLFFVKNSSHDSSVQEHATSSLLK